MTCLFVVVVDVVFVAVWSCVAMLSRGVLHTYNSRWVRSDTVLPDCWRREVEGMMFTSGIRSNHVENNLTRRIAAVHDDELP